MLVDRRYVKISIAFRLHIKTEVTFVLLARVFTGLDWFSFSRDTRDLTCCRYIEHFAKLLKDHIQLREAVEIETVETRYLLLLDCYEFLCK